MAKESPKKKRRIKNPETFRERMQKGAEATAKPKSSKLLKQTSSPVKNKVGKVFRSRPARTTGKFLSPVGKVLLPSYFRKSWQELKQVTWPGQKEGRRLTLAVLIFAVIFGASIAIVDWGLDKVFHQLLLK